LHFRFRKDQRRGLSLFKIPSFFIFKELCKIVILGFVAEFFMAKRLIGSFFVWWFGCPGEKVRLPSLSEKELWNLLILRILLWWLDKHHVGKCYDLLNVCNVYVILSKMTLKIHYRDY
jgi:hypothetical protein